MSNQNIHRMDDYATACMAHPLLPLAGVAYMDGKDCSRQSICISTIPGGHSEVREHMYSKYGIRVMHGAAKQCAEDAEALRTTAIVHSRPQSRLRLARDKRGCALQAVQLRISG